MKSKRIKPQIAYLQQIYYHGLAAVQGQNGVKNWLIQQQYRQKQPKFAVLAIGKAAQSMYDGVYQNGAIQIEQALLISKEGYINPTTAPNTQCLSAGHPLPDARSLAAGQALLNFLDNLAADMPLLCLISGGSSALVEVLADGISLDNLIELNQYLLSRAINIEQTNRIRQQLSKIKAGRLAAYLGKRKTDILFISDVAKDDLSLIGSGLWVEHRPEQLQSHIILPPHLAALLTHSPALAPSACFDTIHLHLIANAQIALNAMQSHIKSQPVYKHTDFIAGDALLAGRKIARYLLDAPVGIHLWHSETTMTLPKNPGKGGRCQSLALAAAQILSGITDCFVLVAASDGNDGVGEASGAWVDGQTWQRGKQAQQHLDQANAEPFFKDLGQLLPAQATGTNVMDFIVAYKNKT